jgi:hypothetical protein
MRESLPLRVINFVTSLIAARPWMALTILAAVCLFMSARSAGPQTSACLVLIDIGGDLIILVACAILARDRQEGEPDYIPGREGQREAIVSSIGLSCVALVTAWKAVPDVVRTGAEVFRWFCVSPRLPSLFFKNAAAASGATGFAVLAAILFYTAYAVSIRRRQTTEVSSCEVKTLANNTITGVVYTLIQFVYLGYVLASPHFARSSVQLLTPMESLVQHMVSLFMTTGLGVLVLWSSLKGAREAFGQACGRRASPAVEEYVEQAVSSIHGIVLTENFRVVDSTPKIGELYGRLDLAEPGQHERAKDDLDALLNDCATYCVRHLGSNEGYRIHAKVEWTHDGAPLSGALRLAGKLGSLIPTETDHPVKILPLIHEGTSFAVDIDPVSFLCKRGVVADPAVVIRVIPGNAGWDEALNQQVKAWTRIHRALRRQRDCSLAYFGMVEIPLGIHLGSLVGSWRRAQIFQRNHRTNTWDLPDDVDSPEHSVVSFQHDEEWDKEGGGRVVVLVEISARIDMAEVRAVLPAFASVLQVSVVNPSRESITARSQIEDVGRQFKKALDFIDSNLPQCTELHLFCAVPCGVSFSLGQQINTHREPPVHVYYYSRQGSPSYSDVLTIRETL